MKNKEEIKIQIKNVVWENNICGLNIWKRFGVSTKDFSEQDLAEMNVFAISRKVLQTNDIEKILEKFAQNRIAKTAEKKKKYAEYKNWYSALSELERKAVDTEILNRCQMEVEHVCEFCGEGICEDTCCQNF
jgi:hypothetical protein